MKQIFKNFFYTAMVINHFYTHTTDSTVTIFVQKYPYLSKSEVAQLKKSPDSSQLSKYSQAIKQPDYLYKNTIKNYNQKNILPGIMCMYAGNVTLSNPEGQISFPRLQQTQDMYILITEKIFPAYMIAPATINNWMINPQYPTEMYLMKHEFDGKTNLSYYQTTKVDLPKNNNIPLNTLIFIADPQTMFIPLGATIVDSSSNITLPTIYVKKGFCFIKNTLFNLATNQYFRDTNPSVKQDEQTVMLIQQPNN